MQKKKSSQTGFEPARPKTIALAGQPVNHSGTVTFKSGNYRFRVLVVYTGKLARDCFGQILMFLLVRFQIFALGEKKE